MSETKKVLDLPQAKQGRSWTTFIRGKRRLRGEMNKTEAEYAAHLDGLKLLGQVLWYEFEAITLVIAKGCRYTPDFAVMMADGELQIHETKGFWAEDAKVKIKCAAEKFPFRFIAMKPRAKKDGGGWDTQEF